jgi:DNA-binding HxlR family transcriptional regulator
VEYGQFCPVAKATEILGEKWTLLIIRELLMGGTRFNVLQRGLSLISPTILTKRLSSLEAQGLVVKKKIQGQRGYEYFPTASCKELLPIIRQIGDWGMRWARTNLTESDYDVDVYFTTSVRTMAGIWMGDTTYRKAVVEGRLTVVGPRELTRDITAWMGNSIFSDIPSANEI